MPKTTTRESDPDTIFVVLEHYGKVAALLSGILLALSVFYDYNFLRALGLSFSDVPTTISDHVRTAILWLPPTLLAAFSSLLLALLIRGLWGKWIIWGVGIVPENIGDTSQEATVKTPTAAGAAPRRWVRTIGLIAGVVVGVIILRISVEVLALDVVYGFFMPTWLAVSFWIVRPLRPMLEKSGSAELWISMFIVVPLVVAYVGETGYGDGRDMYRLRESELGREVVIKTEAGTQTCKLLGLRRFSNVAILVGEQGYATVLPAEQILQVKPSWDVGHEGKSLCP